jgi:class 3 adenylate cyclase
MAQNLVPPNVPATLSREEKITALTLLKNYYDEETFTLLVKEIYNADIGISEAAILSSGSLGNEIAIPHLYQIVERGKQQQRLAAVKSLAAIRAPSSTGMLVKYFGHFPEEELRTEILRAINTISPTAQQVLELNQAVFADPKQSEAVKRIAVEALVEAERYAVLKEALPRTAAGIQEAAFSKMMQTGSQEVLELPIESLAPAPLGCYICVYTLKSKNPQANFVLDALQKGGKQTVLSFLLSLTQFQGRLRFPRWVFKLLLDAPYEDAQTEALVGDFLKKIVEEVKRVSPHLLSDFSLSSSARIDTVFLKARKNYISLQGITNKDVLLATVLATLLERYATPSVLADVQAYFKEDSYSERTPPVAQIRSLLSGAPKEEQNRFEACIPLFALNEKKDRFTVLQQVLRVDLNRPFLLRRLNRLIRVAGALEIKTTARKIQEILEFSRAERIHFLEETSIVTLCQLLTRSIIEQSREYFKVPSRNVRALNGYIRGARYIPAKILVGPLIQISQHPSLNPSSRALVIETLENMNLSGLQKVLHPLLKMLELGEVAEALKLRMGDLVARWADASLGHIALDLTSHGTPVGRRIAIRIVKALAVRGAGASADIVTNRLYLLLEDADRSVRVEALLALLSIGDDYASQIVSDYIKAGDGDIVAEILAGLSKPPTRETFSLLLEMIRLDSLPVQKALRSLLPELCQGSFAEDLRQGLLAALTRAPDEGAKGELPEFQKEDTSAGKDSTLGQAKLEFKLRRESTQILTVFFIDIVDYTKKSTGLQSTDMMKLIKAFEDIVGTAIDKYQGRVVKKMGDGILAYFKSPVAATVAALTVQKKLDEYSALKVGLEKIQARIGLNTGSVIRKGKDIFGPVVNVAARMQSKAEKGEVYLTDATYQEIREHVPCMELGRIDVKGIEEAITAYKALELVADPANIVDDSPEPGLQKLKESIFVPDFKVPPNAAEENRIPLLLKDIFTEISRAIEELAADYQDEFEFKKYLQEKWNALMGSM